MPYLRSWLLLLSVAGCTKPATKTPPAPLHPFPGDALSGKVAVFPLNNLNVDSTLGWGRVLANRPQFRTRVDSMINDLLQERFPQVTWAAPAALRRAAAQAPGMLADPDRMQTTVMPSRALSNIPDPLAAELRELTAVATGGRYALVPANLWFTRTTGGQGAATLVVALADVRTHSVSWGATLVGVGDTPWAAVEQAARKLTPPRPEQH